MRKRNLVTSNVMISILRWRLVVSFARRDAIVMKAICIWIWSRLVCKSETCNKLCIKTDQGDPKLWFSTYFYRKAFFIGRLQILSYVLKHAYMVVTERFLKIDNVTIKSNFFSIKMNKILKIYCSLFDIDLLSVIFTSSNENYYIF